MAKAATDKMAADMAHELKPHGVTAVSLYPGLARTEAVLATEFGGPISWSCRSSVTTKGPKGRERCRRGRGFDRPAAATP